MVAHKQILIRMAHANANRPSSKTFAGRALSRYICKSSTSYDPKFDTQIRRLRPDWFSNTRSIKTSSFHKTEILKIAKGGGPRPTSRSKLGILLYNYIIRSSKCYDQDFDNIIRNLRPDWFDIPRINNARNKRKTLLLQAARDSDRLPPAFTNALRNYTDTTSRAYDADFHAMIRHIRPDWFTKTIVTIELSAEGANKLRDIWNNSDNDPEKLEKRRQLEALGITEVSIKQIGEKTEVDALLPVTATTDILPTEHITECQIELMNSNKPVSAICQRCGTGPCVYNAVLKRGGGR